MRCPFCDQPIDRKTAWKGASDRFYCSEFCADCEMPSPPPRQSLKDRFDQEYLARLARLVALRQQHGTACHSFPPRNALRSRPPQPQTAAVTT
jgi:hypothetical protein